MLDLNLQKDTSACNNLLEHSHVYPWIRHMNKTTSLLKDDGREAGLTKPMQLLRWMLCGSEMFISSSVYKYEKYENINEITVKKRTSYH